MMDEGTQIQHIGFIDENTPAGRTFEFGEEKQKVIFLRIEDGNLIADFEDNTPFLDGPETPYTLEQWNEIWAEEVTGFIDPEPEQEKGNGVVAEADSISPHLQEEILHAFAQFQKDEAAFDKVNKQAKHLKKKMEMSQNIVNTLLKKANEAAEPLPLFDQKEEEPNNEWRNVGLSELEISDKILDALSEHEPSITTLGELTDWQRDKGGFWAKDIKGIGEAAVTEIADASEKFFAEHPEYMEKEEPEDVPDIPPVPSEVYE